jgi:hypothetical protein
VTDTRTGGVVIRTPDQRLRVFVSSTLDELAAERRAVERAVAALRLTPVMFELGARPHPPRELYRAYLAQSDVFVGLYWQRYGWVAPGMQISGLQDEFDLFGGRPRQLYVKTPAPARDPRLADLLQRIGEQASYRHFSTAAELGRLLRDDLAVLLSERFTADRAAPAAKSSAGGPRPLPSGRRCSRGRPRGCVGGPGCGPGRRHPRRATWSTRSVGRSERAASTNCSPAARGSASQRRSPPSVPVRRPRARSVELDAVPTEPAGS